MVIVRIQGGLANQMYQYVFYHWLVQKHKEKGLKINTFIDNSMYYHKVPKQECDPVHNGYELKQVFGIEAPVAELQDIYRLSEYRYDLFRKALIKARITIKGRLASQINDDNEDDLKQNLATIDEKYFSGTWSCLKYANDYSDEIRNIFSFPIIDDLRNTEAKKMIEKTNSVSVHVRRGDYLNIQNGINLGMDYYNNAMFKISEIVESPYFFVFSDDIEWCKANFDYKNICFVEWNNGKESYRDMQLMSLCKHNIVANSTFSTWASWLNSNENKVILRPGHNGSVLEGLE